MKKHVYQIADATADALAKQFTKKFSWPRIDGQGGKDDIH